MTTKLLEEKKISDIKNAGNKGDQVGKMEKKLFAPVKTMLREKKIRLKKKKVKASKNAQKPSSKTPSKLTGVLEKLSFKFGLKGKKFLKFLKIRKKKDFFKGQVWKDNTKQKKVFEKKKKELLFLKSQIAHIKTIRIISPSQKKKQEQKKKKKRTNWYQLSGRAKRKKRLLALQFKKKKLLRFALFLRTFGNPPSIINTFFLKAFVTKYGKIKGRRKTKLSVQDQRKIAKLVKQARSFQIIPCLSPVKFRFFKRYKKKFKNFQKNSSKLFKRPRVPYKRHFTLAPSRYAKT